MKNLVAALLLAAFVTPSVVSSAGIVEDAHNHGVRHLITPSLDQQGMMTTGSLVMIAGKYAVTAEHIPVNDQSHIRIEDLKYRVRTIHEPEKNGIDQARLLHVSGGPYAFVPIGKRPNVGDEVYTYGFPGGAPYRSSGHVTTPDDVNMQAFEAFPANVIVCDFPIGNGNSGGGLFNANGELVGVAGSSSDTRSFWIGTESLQEAVAGMDPTQERYERADESANQRVVVITLPPGQCPPCEQLKRDIKAGKFPGYDFEFIVYDSDLGTFSNPELHAQFVKECKPGGSLRVPTIWIPGTGKYREGYTSNRGLLGWIQQALQYLATPLIGPPIDQIPTAPVAPRQPSGGVEVDIGGTIQSVPDQVKGIASEAKEALAIARELKDAGLIEKVKLLREGKDKAEQLRGDVGELKQSVQTLSENKAKVAWYVVYGLISGLISGPLQALGLKEAA